MFKKNVVNKLNKIFISQALSKFSKKFKDGSVSDIFKDEREFEKYIKKEDINKKEEEKNKMQRLMKKEESLKCLVLHPVFSEKYLLYSNNS